MEILIWPHPKLKLVSAEVEQPVNLSFIEEMYDTMKAAGGAGLSAIQIGFPTRVVVAEVPERFWPPKTEEIEMYSLPDVQAIAMRRYVWVNPTFVPVPEMKMVPVLEGCLSTPGQFETVYRYPEILATWQDPATLDKVEQRLTGLAAQVFQHELEHLDGKMFVEHLKPADRSRIRGTMVAYKKRTGK